MGSSKILPKLVSPKAVSIILLTLVSLALIAEVAHYYWAEDQPLTQVDQSLAEDAGGLYAVLSLAKQQGLSSSAIRNTVSQYYSLVRTGSYFEILENDSTLFRSTDLDPRFSFRSLRSTASGGGPITLQHSPTPMRVYTKAEGRYKLYVARSLSEIDLSWKKTHSALSFTVIALLILLAPGGLIIALYWHRPTRILKKHIESLSLQPKHLPLPPIPDFTNNDTSQLVRRIHTILENLHDSRSRALTFSSMASHEMRTPLSIIRHQLEVALSMPYQDPSLQKAIASAYDEVLRLNGTVEDLLNLSTLQTGTANLSFTYFGLHDFLKTFYDEAMFLTREKGISVVFAKVSPVTIEADAGRLRQVLFNLLDNSIKNTPAEGKIRITAEAQENDVLITFSDTGRGISPQNMTRIFEPFYSETSNDADVRGTGLGLSLVKWIVESHNGKLDVESKLNEGTTFFIRIPKFQSTPN
jgi:signal transduction histidine kinase